MSAANVPGFCAPFQGMTQRVDASRFGSTGARPGSTISPLRFAGRSLWWVVRAGVALRLALLVATLYQQDSWLSTHYRAGYVDVGVSNLVLNMMHSVLFSWTYVGAGDILTGTGHVLLPLTLATIVLSIAGSL